MNEKLLLCAKRWPWLCTIKSIFNIVLPICQWLQQQKKSLILFYFVFFFFLILLIEKKNAKRASSNIAEKANHNKEKIGRRNLLLKSKSILFSRCFLLLFCHVFLFLILKFYQQQTIPKKFLRFLRFIPFFYRDEYGKVGCSSKQTSISHQAIVVLETISTIKSKQQQQRVKKTNRNYLYYRTKKDDLFLAPSFTCFLSIRPCVSYRCTYLSNSSKKKMATAEKSLQTNNNNDKKKRESN